MTTHYPKILTKLGLSKWKLLKLAKAEGSKLPLSKLTKMATSSIGSAMHELITEELLKEARKKRRKTK